MFKLKAQTESIEIVVNNNHNMEDVMKRANQLIKITNMFREDIDISVGSYTIDGKSIMGLFSLNLSVPMVITIHSNDKDVIKLFLERMEDFNNGLN